MTYQYSRKPGPRPVIAPPWINHRLVKHACGLYFYEAHWNGGPEHETSIYYLSTGEVATVCPKCGGTLETYTPLYQLHRNCDHKECQDWQRAIPNPPGGGADTIINYGKTAPRQREAEGTDE